LEDSLRDRGENQKMVHNKFTLDSKWEGNEMV